MAGRNYYAPHGGLPPQTQLLTGRAVFTEAYVVIPKGVMRDIVTSALPFWDDTRVWILSRPLSGFAETFLAIHHGGGAGRRQRPAGAGRRRRGRAVRRGGRADRHARRRGASPAAGRLCLPAAGERLDASATTAARRRASTGSARLYERVDGIDVPEPFFRNEQDIVPLSDARHRRPLGDDALRRSGRPAPRHARQHRHLRAGRASSPSPRRMSWSTGSTCWKARRSTASTRTGSRSRPATTCGCAPSARRPAMPAAPASSATCSTRTSTGT